MVLLVVDLPSDLAVYLCSLLDILDLFHIAQVGTFLYKSVWVLRFRLPYILNFQVSAGWRDFLHLNNEVDEILWKLHFERNFGKVSCVSVANLWP
jgi:hypothetical protein